MSTVTPPPISTWIAPEKQKTVLGHPVGLFVLFFTEMWERFSYYGMRALLVLYMTKYLLLDPVRAQDVLGYTVLKDLLEGAFGPLDVQPISSHLYGLYTGFVYLSPFFGGMIADKVWGQRKTVYVGGFLMAVGHFLMAIESMFLLALFFIILGNGAFKPNISTQVGNLYKPGDGRRDGAFVIFYMGVNLGAFFSPLVCGTLGQTVGWHYGFGAAGVGMLGALAVYHWGRKYLPQDVATQNRQSSFQPTDSTFPIKALLTFCAIAIGFFMIIISPVAIKASLIIAAVLGIAFVLKKMEESDRSRVVAIMIMCLCSIGFWAIYEQQGNTMQLWADEQTDWHFLGFDVPSTYFQSMNPFFIFIFAPLLSGWWESRLKKGKSNGNTETKMALGSVLTGLAFVIMVIAAKIVPAGEKGSLLWLAGATWVVTMGEIYLSPIGLSMVTKVAPPKYLSAMMGVWFLSSFFGNYFGGYLGSFYSLMPKDVFFLLNMAIGVGLGIVFFMFGNKLKKTIGDA